MESVGYERYLEKQILARSETIGVLHAYIEMIHQEAHCKRPSMKEIRRLANRAIDAWHEQKMKLKETE